MEVIFNIGISGAGKSTWSTQFIKNNPNYLRINRDDIRKTLVGNLDGYYQRKDLQTIEQLINSIEESLFIKIINNAQYNLIIDNTHLKMSYINKWFKIIKNLEGYSEINFKFKIFDVALNEARGRIWNREGLYISSLVTIIECKELDYIDKQFEQYQQIKKHIQIHFPNNII